MLNINQHVSDARAISLYNLKSSWPYICAYRIYFIVCIIRIYMHIIRVDNFTPLYYRLPMADADHSVLFTRKLLLGILIYR